MRGPDLPSFSPVEPLLRWDRPLSWRSVGRSLRSADLVVLVAVVPFQVPALLTVARAARPARVVVIAHNVIPHETHPGGRWLMERLVRAVDGVVVHSAEQGVLAREHGARSVVVADLAPHLPGGVPSPAGAARAALRPPRDPADPVRVLALGMVRDYKATTCFWRPPGRRRRSPSRSPASSGGTPGTGCARRPRPPSWPAG
jgi:hypothetical protein